MVKQNSDPTYKQVIEKLLQRGVMPKTAPGLTKTKKALAALGLDPENIYHALNNDLSRSVLIAGTNGKGTTAACLEALLLSQNKTVGLFTSPHLVDHCERIRINGQDISQAEFVEAFLEIDKKTKDLKLSHFETLTAMAAWCFFKGPHRPVADYALFEVGLGGKWDSTNAIAHGTCLITPLSQDHTELLGESLTEIAENKFAIIPEKSQLNPEGAKVIYAPFHRDLLELKKQIQLKTQSQWVSQVAFEYRSEKNGLNPKFFLKTRFFETELNLPGKRSAQNASLALTAFMALGFDPNSGKEAFKQIRWPGRMEKVNAFGKTVFLSGDHNPAGVESLIELLNDYEYDQIKILVGVGLRKKVDEILEPLSKLDSSKIFLTTPSFQGRSSADYGKWIQVAQDYNKDPIEALKDIADSSNSKDLLIVTGSLYLVGEIKEKLRAL